MNVEKTLTKEIDELAQTYLRTAVTQLEKKLDQIIKLYWQIMELILEPDEIEETIMDSDEVQDLIMENINELNKRVETLSRPTTTKVTVSTLQDSDSDSVTSQEDLGDHKEATSKEDNNEIVSAIAINTCSITVSVPTINNTPVVLLTSNTMSSPSSTVPLLDHESFVYSAPLTLCSSDPSISLSSVSYPSVSYVHSLGPPPLIPRVTIMKQYPSL